MAIWYFNCILVSFIATWYFYCHFGIFSTFLVSCTKKNLATLVSAVIVSIMEVDRDAKNAVLYVLLQATTLYPGGIRSHDPYL
jgi:3-methyladenine DNA glycosylase Mpg